MVEGMFLDEGILEDLCKQGTPKPHENPKSPNALNPKP